MARRRSKQTGLIPIGWTAALALVLAALAPYSLSSQQTREELTGEALADAELGGDFLILPTQLRVASR